MTAYFTVAMAHVGAFLRWWVAELAGMLPASLAKPRSGVSPAAIIFVDRSGRLIHAAAATGSADRDGEQSPPATREEDAFHATGAAVAAQLVDAHTTRGLATVALRLPLTACYSRFVELPAAARKDFAQLLALDMERATPFRNTEIYSDFVILPKAAAKPGKTLVRQVIIKRSLLAAPLAELQAAGVHVEQIDCWDETAAAPLGLTFRSALAPGARDHRSLLRPILVACSIAALLAAWGASMTLDNSNASLARLDAQVQVLRARAARQKTAKDASSAAQALLTALETLATSPPPKLAVINELTQLLPDSAWVNDLRVTTEGVDINGFAQSTVDLLPPLERSNLFMDATSSAAVTYDPREGKERYSIHVRYRPAPMERVQGGGFRP